MSGYHFRRAAAADRGAIIEFMNLHWGARHPLVNLPDYFTSVSYTHLDVYKRQAESGSLLRQYDVYTHLLPAVDVDMLRAGIDVYSDDQLQRLIEDYGA